VQINLIADSSISSAPVGFTAAVQQAAAIFDHIFPGNYTLNIRYGWGTWDNQVDPNLAFANGAEGGPVNGTTVSYATVKSWLTASATLPDQHQALASLPANVNSFPGDANAFYVSSAQEKAFGVYSGSSTEIDGAIGFGKVTNAAFWLEGALHEIAHAIGRTTDFYAGDPTIMDLFRYSSTSTGQYDWTGYNPAYFSINGGRTDLANFSDVSDFADFAVDQLTPSDPFNWMIDGTTHTLTSIDIELMNILGFGSIATPPNIIVAAVSEVAVQANQAVAGSTLFASISNPHNDTITHYLYLDEGGGSGYFTVNGIPQADGQWISAGTSDVVQYVGGSSAGSDQLEVGVYDATTGSYAYSSLFNGITTASQSNPPNAPNASWQVSGFGDFGGTGHAEMMLRDDASGELGVQFVSNSSAVADGAASNPIALGQVGLDWQVAGFGSFNGNVNETDMLMRDSTTGAFEIYDINNNAITSAAAMGQVGLNWGVVGFGDFSSNPHETDMLMRDSNSGAFELYDISNNVLTGAASMGRVGLNWQIAGFGDFSSAVSETDMLLRDANTGTFEIYDIAHNNITLAFAMGQVGLEWQIVGFGDFSGNANETDMLMRDSNSGVFEIYDINNNHLSAAIAMGQVGLDWSVVGLGDFSGHPNETDLLMVNNNTGVFELYDINDNTVTSATSVGQLGLSGQQAATGGAAPSAPTDGSVPSAPSPANTDTLFVFLGNFGQNTVEQFNPLIDKIELAATEFPDFSAVENHMQQVGGNTVITYDAHDSITLVGVAAASLNASNFEFTYGFQM
jgi:hypothetical protein